jgi:hypothetical protein
MPSSKRRLRKPARVSLCEKLEERTLFSAIIWQNKGSDASDTDNFSAIFGADASLARADVQQALGDWSAVIQNFNYSVGPDQLPVYISADGAAGFGANASFGSEYQGKPIQGSISLNTGIANRPDRGYYLDPHPEDDGEFRGNIVNAYAADAPVGSPAFGKYDLYTVVALEMAHELGLNNSGSELFTSDPNHYLTDTGQTDKSLVGELWAYNGPDVQALFTTDNALTQDLGAPVHTAEPAAGNQVTLNGVTYYGAQDSDNAKFEIGRRYLPSYLDALVLKDSYGYTVRPPARNMYATFDVTTGSLLIRGGQSGEGFYGGVTPSNDTITLASDASFADVTVQIGTPVPGTGPNVPLVSSFAVASVTSITIDGNDGSDTINVQSAPAPLTIRGTSQAAATDSVFLNPGITATLTAIPIGTAMSVRTGGSDSVTLDYSTGAIDGAITLDGAGSLANNSLRVRGASATDTFTVNPGSITHGNSVVAFDAVSAAGLVLDTGGFSIPAGLNSGTVVTVSGQGAAMLAGGATLGALDIDTAHVTLSGSAGDVVAVHDFQMSNGGSLDVAHASLLIRYAGALDPAARIRSYLKAPSTLTSTAIDAAHGVALADAADGTVAAVPTKSLLLKLARFGDANLDGTVNFTDLLLLAQHYGQSAANWDVGDFNNDGSVAFADLLTLAQNYGSGGAGSASAFGPLAAAAPVLAATTAQTRQRPARRRR